MICNVLVITADFGMYQHYTAKNATDLLQVVKFTGLLQLVNKLQQAC